ncbi:MAG: NAD(P)/FAD-dependent oxidoreductase [Planctomycetes bacterium]|nr:NAD(P)/FAD-dependent oxidoreductase [Planctomycetota bacterium]
MPTTHVIIGSGIAGLCAAESTRQIDPQAVIRMVSEEPHEFYSRPGLAYFLRNDFPESQLTIRTPEDVAALNLQRVHGQADKLACDTHEIVLKDGRRVRYDRLLLATGALAVPPPFPGGNLAGVVTLDGLDDCRKIIAMAWSGYPAVVVGGGITALELAEGLNARGMKVEYFLRSTRYWADVLDETESKIVMDRLRHEGITIHTETQVKQAIGSDGRLTGVETQAGKHFPCEVLAVAIGVRPRIELAKQAGLLVGKGIAVDQYLQTSAPDVFAAGDCAEVFDPVSGKPTLDVLWPTAIVQGRIAGANMAGAARPYVKGVPYNVTMLAGLKVSIIGAVSGGAANEDLVAITRGESEAWRVVPKSWVVGADDDVNRVRLVVGDCTIAGALVMGDQTWSRPLQQLIIGKVDITPIRPALIAGGAEALTQLAKFYREWEKRV